MRIAVCDDCPEDSMYLLDFLKDHSCQVFHSPSALLTAADKASSGFDLYFLDIYMDGQAEGIALAKELRHLDEDCVICFISSSDEFYREAYDIMDTNYLLKPVSESALQSFMERVQRKLGKTRQKSFCYKRNGQMVSIPYSSIQYIGSNNHILNIYCKNDIVYQCSSKLDDVEALLDSSVFYRCHQSFLVNLYCVDHLSGTDFMIGKKLIPISRRYFSEARQRYHAILFEEVT